MSGLVYMPGVSTLSFDGSACTGCGVCLTVCPHGVFAPLGRVVKIGDPDRCIECGACSRNCAAGAITVEPGVGCALAILKGRLSHGSTASCGSGSQVDGCQGGPAAGGKPC